MQEIVRLQLMNPNSKKKNDKVENKIQIFMFHNDIP